MSTKADTAYVSGRRDTLLKTVARTPRVARFAVDAWTCVGAHAGLPLAMHVGNLCGAGESGHDGVIVSNLDAQFSPQDLARSFAGAAPGGADAETAEGPETTGSAVGRGSRTRA